VKRTVSAFPLLPRSAATVALQESRAPTRSRGPTGRKGAVVVEVAIVAPLTFLLIIGIIVGGFGVFRYQQLASLAREGARWASVRGPEYERSLKKKRPTAEDVFQAAILPRAVSLDPSRLTYSINWNADRTLVKVQLSYDWLPEGVLFPVTFRAVSEMPITF
jgi:Flp pilus assembly protein TadG